MSLQRGRNLYTMGDFHLGANSKVKRRQQPSDPFEKDPFKIQSYNFHYAERPTYPLTAPSLNILKPEPEQDCQTFFYNSNFPSTESGLGPRPTTKQNNDGYLNSSKFQEYRRRKFLHDPGPSLIRPLPFRELKDNDLNCRPKIRDTTPKNFYYQAQNNMISPGCFISASQDQPSSSQGLKNQNTLSHQQILSTKRIHSSESFKQEIARLPNPSANSRLVQTRSQNSGHRRSSSGCEIRINIKNLEERPLKENINIQIESDSKTRSITLPLNKPFKSRDYTNIVIRNEESSHRPTNIFIEKPDSLSSYNKKQRLSKFEENPGTSSNIKTLARDRLKDLTAIYSSQQNIKKSNTKIPRKTNERLPSYIPFKTSSSVRSLQSNTQSAITPQKSLVQKVKENLRMYESKTGSLKNNLYRPKVYNSSTLLPQKVNNSKQRPISSSVHSLSTSRQGSYLKSTSPLSLRNNSKSPLNVNINVYADKMKLFKV